MHKLEGHAAQANIKIRFLPISGPQTHRGMGWLTLTHCGEVKSTGQAQSRRQKHKRQSHLAAVGNGDECQHYKK